MDEPDLFFEFLLGERGRAATPIPGVLLDIPTWVAVNAESGALQVTDIAGIVEAERNTGLVTIGAGEQPGSIAESDVIVATFVEPRAIYDFGMSTRRFDLGTLLDVANNLDVALMCCSGSHRVLIDADRVAEYARATFANDELRFSDPRLPSLSPEELELTVAYVRRCNHFIESAAVIGTTCSARPDVETPLCVITLHQHIDPESQALRGTMELLASRLRVVNPNFALTVIDATQQFFAESLVYPENRLFHHVGRPSFGLN